MVLFDDSYFVLGKEFTISESIVIRNPTLKEIFSVGEERYFTLVHSFVSTPNDCKVQLFDIGLDYEQVRRLDFFYWMTNGIPVDQSHILFGDLDFSKFKPSFMNNEWVLSNDSIIIDELSCDVLTNFICKMNGFPIKKPDKFSSEHAKKYFMENERIRLKYAKKEKFKPFLTPLISALVNSPECNYSYETIFDLRISQLFDSISRVTKVRNYQYIMTGLYSGSIQHDKINLNEISWLN